MCLNLEYKRFRSKLEKVLNKSTCATADIKQGEALQVDLVDKINKTDTIGNVDDMSLQILQKEWKAGELVDNDNEMGDDITPSEDKNTAHDEAAQLPMTADTALNILLHNAVEEFGQAPRDVYNGVFHFSETKVRHDAHVRQLTCAKLSDLVAVFATTRGLDEFSDHVVAVNVEQNVAACFDEWTIGSREKRWN